MNILMVHPHDIYSSLEPWTVRIVYIAKEFNKKGHKVKLVYFPLEWHQQEIGELEGINTVPMPRRHGPFFLLSNILRLYSLSKWADVIHFQKCFYHASLPVILAASLRNKPLHYDWDDWEVKIYEASTDPSFLANTIKKFLNILERLIPKIADTISVASERLKKECLKLGIEENRIFDSHVGADIEKFHPSVSGVSIKRKHNISGPLVLYLGQLHGGQYAELFIKAAAKIINEYKENFNFMIVGDGCRLGKLKELVHSFDLDGRIIFTGAVPHEQVPSHIAAADVCVACFEDNEVTACKSPLKIVEYLASGKAIVASNVGEVPKMIEDAGVLVTPGDAQSLTVGMVRIMQDPDFRKELGKRARLRAEQKYNWTVTSENLLCAYKKALNNHLYNEYL
ncbi:MAG: glycosyltransferase family 4 protein [Candidatus Omnitrophica bacterium]|nr:glycosyltransferase family 4 protein [Candidatus Omnitrophota bacterium]